MAKRKATRHRTANITDTPPETMVSTGKPFGTQAEPLGEGAFTKRCPVHGLVKVSGGRVSKCPVGDCGSELVSAKGTKPVARKPRASVDRKGFYKPASANGSTGATHPLNAAAVLLEACGGLAEAKATLDRLANIAKLCK